MYTNRFLILIGIIFLFVSGCGTETGDPSTNNGDINITQISNKDVFDQTYSNQAKQALAKNNHVTFVTAINTDKKLIIAVEIPHHERFKLKNIEKKLQKEMRDKFKDNDIKVELSTDQKIIWELEKLEKKVKNSSINKKEFKKEMKHISKLMKEQT